MAFLVAGYWEGSYWESSLGFGSPSSEFEASSSGGSVNAWEYAGKKNEAAGVRIWRNLHILSCISEQALLGNEAHVLG